MAAINPAADRPLRIGNQRFRPHSADELGANAPAGNPIGGYTKS
jgi:hypothetical protein